jgi:uncharacterized protein with PQ loop repeat
MPLHDKIFFRIIGSFVTIVGLFFLLCNLSIIRHNGYSSISLFRIILDIGLIIYGIFSFKKTYIENKNG